MALGRSARALLCIALVAAALLVGKEFYDSSISHPVVKNAIHLQGQDLPAIERRLELPGVGDGSKLNDRLLDLQRAIHAVLGVDALDNEVPNAGLLITIVDGPAAQILLPLLLESLQRLPSRPDRQLLAVAMDAEALEACQLHHSACLRRTMSAKKMQERRQRVVRVGVGRNDGTEEGKVRKGRDPDNDQNEQVGSAERRLLERKRNVNPYGSRYQLGRSEGRALDAVPFREEPDTEGSDARGHSLSRVNEGRKKARRKAKTARRAKRDGEKGAAVQGGGGKVEIKDSGTKQQGSDKRPVPKQVPKLEHVKMPAIGTMDIQGMLDKDSSGQWQGAANQEAGRGSKTSSGQAGTSKSKGGKQQAAGVDSEGAQQQVADSGDSLTDGSEKAFRGGKAKAGKAQKASKAAGVDSSGVVEHLEQDAEPEVLMGTSDELPLGVKGTKHAAGVDSAAMHDHFEEDPEVLTEKSSPERASAGFSKEKTSAMSKSSAKRESEEEWQDRSKRRGRSAGVDSQGVREQIARGMAGGEKKRGKGRAAGVDSEAMREHAEQGDLELQDVNSSKFRKRGGAAGADSQAMHELTGDESALQAADAGAVKSDGQEALSVKEASTSASLDIAEAAAEEMNDLRKQHHHVHKDASERHPVTDFETSKITAEGGEEEDYAEEDGEQEGILEEQEGMPEEEGEENLVSEPETDGGLMSEVAKGSKKAATLHDSLWDRDDIVMDAQQDVQTEGIFHVRRRMLQLGEANAQEDVDSESDVNQEGEQASSDEKSRPGKRRQQRRKRKEGMAAKAATIDWERVNVMRDVATLGFEALYTEPDVVWLQDPLFALLLDAPAEAGADIAVVAQGAAASIVTHNRANISLSAVLIRPTPVAKVLLGEWHRRQSKPAPMLLLEFQRAWSGVKNRHPELKVQTLKENRYVSGCSMKGSWSSEISEDPSRVPVGERKDWVLWHASCSGDLQQKQAYLQSLLTVTKVNA